MKKYYFLILFVFVSQCRSNQDAYLHSAKSDFHSNGFLTQSIFQTACALELSPNEQEFFAGSSFVRVSNVSDTEHLFVSVRSRFLQQCRTQAALLLAQERLRMQKINPTQAEEKVQALIPHMQKFLPGKLVYEQREGRFLRGMYRIEMPDFIFAVGKIKIE